MRWSHVSVLVALAGLAAAAAPSARAQAWTPPKGEASLSIGLGTSFADEHLDDNGNNLLLPDGAGWGSMKWNEGDTELGYGITDRLAVSVALPFVVSRYQGEFPHPLLPGHRNEDDGHWHSTFGDFRAELRFKATTGSLVVTPLVAVLAPSHSYEFIAHAAAGLGLTEGRVGVNVGRLLDPLLPNGYAQVRYTLTVPEKALGISHDWSSVYFDAGYFVTGALTVNVLGEWQKTHGGWRFVDIPLPPNPNFVFHDQLQRADHFRLGGAVSYALTGSLEIGLSGYGTIHAQRDMNVAGFSLNMTYNFSPSQLIKRGKTPMGRPGKAS